MADIETARAKLFDLAKLDLVSPNHEEQNLAKRKEVARTFTSDTVTVPSPEMFEYATKTSLGDDGRLEPSTAALEEHIARLTGKEAGLFVTSGTQANQLALRSHLMQPPHTVMCDHRANLYLYEGGGAALHSGAQSTAVVPSNGHHLTLEDVKNNMIYGPDVHFAPTEVVALENTLHGTIFPQEEIIAISEFVHAKGAKLHLDGARIWHVAAETGKTLKELCEPFDSVSMCFSKGLGAPIGSCLVGSKDFIARARRFRKLFGAGMRQTGFLAGCAAYALSHNLPQLPRVHQLARKLAAGLEEIGVAITTRTETCMVFYNPQTIGVSCDEIVERCGRLPEPITLTGSRLVVHIQTSDAAVNDFLVVVRELADEKTKEGFVKPDTAQTTVARTMPTTHW